MRSRAARVAGISGVATATAAGLVLVATGASAAGESRPFPFHVQYQVGVLPSASPSARDAAVRKQYDSWKATYLVHGCASSEYYVSTKGDSDAQKDGPVSEGQGYGLQRAPLLAWYDAYAKVWLDGQW